jgi:2-amino-4-hydroxy-6-hydroxymethyldihydropteridine diphosphokinase
VIKAAFGALDEAPLVLLAESAVLPSRPVGPSSRQFANAAAIVETMLEPVAMLAHLKTIERRFGRRPGGQRWGSRVLDLDIILWSGGIWSGNDLGIPHAPFRSRAFVLKPAARLAGAWRDPVTGLRLRHLATRLDRRRPAA